MSTRHLIIHGHFYQPPRENPWILAIEPQETAAPYADWNLRINRECYAPNTKSRLLGPDGSITRLINNYEYLSFNFGPTLLSWLEKADPGTYASLIAADRRAAEARGGHGPALAQVYNHIIMPLANTRDRLTQIRWGLCDFETRFGRRPEGMWLAETAADLETLRMLAEAGIKFTILSQGQARAVRPLAAKSAAAGDTGQWCDVAGGRVDPREPYRVFWGSGPSDYLDVFFYDGPVSRAIAFENLLSSGVNLLRRVEEAFGDPKPGGAPRLVNLATDGESYGHHFAFGDMALAWLFDHLEQNAGGPEAIRLTNYGEYLAKFPPVMEARIFDDTSWSCAHGVERWRSDCGCNTGGGGGRWNQKWRKPLREGFDWLRDQMAEVFTGRTRTLLADPWAARDDYLRVIISGYDPKVQAEFLKTHQTRPLSGEEATVVLSLMESQLMSLFMFTSCGWFFDEVSGLEPVQNLRYALRGIELAGRYASGDLAAGLTDFLKTIKPNVEEYPTGLDLWREKVAVDSLGLQPLAAHWAASAVLDVPAMLDCFVEPNFSASRLVRLEGEGVEIIAGAVDIIDRRLARTDRCLCLGLYSGGTHLAVLTRAAGAEAADPPWLQADYLRAALEPDLNVSAALALWEKMTGLMPGGSRFILEDLLPHCRRMLLDTLVEGLYDSIKNHAMDIFHRNQHLFMMNRSSGQTLTWMERFLFRVMGEAELRRILGPADFDRPVNLPALTSLLNRRGLVGLAREEPVLADAGPLFLAKVFHSLRGDDAEHRKALLTELIGFVKLTREEGFDIDLWASQNKWYTLRADQDFMSRLSPEESALMGVLGVALGFSENFESGLIGLA